MGEILKDLSDPIFLFNVVQQRSFPLSKKEKNKKKRKNFGRDLKRSV